MPKFTNTESSKYAFEHLHDEYECDVCGVSYSEGFRLSDVRGVVAEFEPVAHCLGGHTLYSEQLLPLILDILGKRHGFEVTGLEDELEHGNGRQAILEHLKVSDV